MTKELKRFEQWWDAEDDIPNDGPYTPDTPIQFAWAGWQAALAQPEQEPVAWMKASDTEWSISFFKQDGYVPLYTIPPQRKPLEDEEICPWFQKNTALTNEAAMRIVRAIEAAHGIKE